MKSKPKQDDELIDWIDALDNLILFNGHDDSKRIISEFVSYAKNKGLLEGSIFDLPFENTIPKDIQLNYPGDLDIEKKIRHYIRWNALITVLKANSSDDLGGHISTYSSAATLYETAFNHFFKGYENQLGDLIFIRDIHLLEFTLVLFLEGRLQETDLDNFRREIDGRGLSSYPHPWLMPDYWQFQQSQWV